MKEQFTERPKPYIGVSGIVDTEQQYYLMDQFTKRGLDKERLIALGVKAVHKTQFLDIENKYGTEWYPVGAEAFSKALDSTDADTLRVAQVYFDPEYVNDPEYRKVFVERICRRGKSWLNTIQFDMLPWHTDNSLLSFAGQVKAETGLKVILQAHGESMQQLGPDGVTKKLEQHAHEIDYVLFDASHGKGILMNADALKPFLDAGYNSDKLSGVGFGVAGGLNADAVREKLPELLEEYSNLSWDAEGRLRPTLENETRPLDIALTTQYLEASAEIL